MSEKVVTLYVYLNRNMHYLLSTTRVSSYTSVMIMMDPEIDSASPCSYLQQN